MWGQGDWPYAAGGGHRPESAGAGAEPAPVDAESESDAAHRLYASVGFEAYGVERQAMKLDDRFVDVTLMTLALSPTCQ